MKIKTVVLTTLLASCFALSTIADAKGGGGGGQSARSSGHSSSAGNARSNGGQSNHASSSRSNSKGGYASKGGYGKEGRGRCHSKAESSVASPIRGFGARSADRDTDKGNFPIVEGRPRDLAN